jgi:phage terminase large subunit GpA-like protein
MKTFNIPESLLKFNSEESIPNYTSIVNRLTRQILQPKPRLSGAEWANSYYYLSPENSAEPGKYNFNRMPWQEEMINVACDDQYKDVVFQTSARVGKTTVMLIATGYFMHQSTSPILWLLPTETVAKQFSTNDVDPMIRDTPVLNHLVNDKFTRDGGNNVLSKRYTGGSMTLVGAQNSSGLHGKTIRVLLADEIDRYPESAGTDGDVLDLAGIRTTTFQHKAKRIYASTPSITDISSVERKFKESDQRHYHVPCPACEVKQILEWESLSYKEDPTAPVYVCKHCGHSIKENQKYKMLLNGEWIRHNPDSNIAGFFLNALYSVNMSWAELVQEWTSIGKNRHRLQVFMNSRLAKTFQLVEEYIGVNKLAERVEIYGSEVPTKSEQCNGVGVLTCGVDIQKNRIEAYVWGYGKNDECFMIDFRLFEGDTNKNMVFDELTKFLLSEKYKTANNAEIGIRAIAIDSGFNSNRVARYVRDLKTVDHANRTIIAIKGDSNYTSGILEKQAKFYKESGQLYFRVGTNPAKDHIATLFQNPEVGENYVHLPTYFPKRFDQDRYLDKETLYQLTSEKKVYEYKGSRRIGSWKQMRDRNEALDCFVYSYAALLALGPQVFSKLDELAKKVSELEPAIIDENDEVNTQNAHPVRRIPQIKPGITLHRPMNNGFSMFSKP